MALVRGGLLPLTGVLLNTCLFLLFLLFSCFDTRTMSSGLAAIKQPCVHRVPASGLARRSRRQPAPRRAFLPHPEGEGVSSSSSALASSSPGRGAELSWLVDGRPSCCWSLSPRAGAPRLLSLCLFLLVSESVPPVGLYPKFLYQHDATDLRVLWKDSSGVCCHFLNIMVKSAIKIFMRFNSAGVRQMRPFL